MISAIVTLLIIFGILLVFTLVFKLVKFGITIAVIVGIVAIIMHFAKKKS